MKSLTIKYFGLILLIGFLTQSCKKDEGQGGTSTINGKIIVHDFDAAFLSAQPLAIYPARDEKTYIIYGADGTTYDDNFSTSYDGTYEFKYLQKGTYKIFAYTKDSTGAKSPQGYIDGQKVAKIITVEITKNGTTVTAPDLIILSNKQ